MGGILWPVAVPQLIPRVSSRAPVWGASFRAYCPVCDPCFKSCPRVGGIPQALHTTTNPGEVSSRAPVWGASFKFFRKIFRHALFQVVPPCGGHQGNKAAANFARRVSSRAPVWGASSLVHVVALKIRGFKSCPRVGGIWIDSRRKMLKSVFQVVPPCGGHLPNQRADSGRLASFKSCPRVGGIPQLPTYSVVGYGVSSRAPVWGASPTSAGLTVIGGVSSRAPVWGASQNAALPGGSADCFKSCPRVGGITANHSKKRFPSRFQVVPPCGGHLQRQSIIPQR